MKKVSHPHPHPHPHPMLLLLQMMIIYATSAAGSSGLETACQKTPNVKFCTDLLNPYASQFVDNDSYKMGYAAISATVAQVQAMRAFMVRQTTEPEASEEERAAVKECLALVAKSDDSLRRASHEFDQMRAAANGGEQHSMHKDNVIRNIDSARSDLIACVDLLKKHKNAAAGSKVIGEAVLQADRSVKACFLAHAFVHEQHI